MKAYGQRRFWGTAIRCFLLAGTMAAAVTLVSPAGLEAQNPQHQAIQDQITTHDGNQTSQHSGLPPTWDKTLPADNPGGACPNNSSRFTCVMNGFAVRDNETGLVWEQSPSTSFFTWFDAHIHCNNLTVGNRKGWRLPTVHELASLVDIGQTNPALPAGHPFSNVFLSGNWSATTCGICVDSRAWQVSFGGGGVSTPGLKSGATSVWCARGGQGVDQ